MCPEGRFDVLDLATGDRFAETCKRLRCAFCGPIQAAARSQLAAASRPERLVTFTRVPEDWQERRQWQQNVVHNIRRAGFSWEMFWATERNPKGTGFHIHALQHGDFVPQRLIQQITRTIPDIRAVRTEIEAAAGKVARYVIKGAGRTTARYVVKGTAADMPEHLELNGGRPAHWTRGYMRTDENDPITARALKRLLQRAKQGDWLVIDRSTTDAECQAIIAMAKEHKCQEA